MKMCKCTLILFCHSEKLNQYSANTKKTTLALQTKSTDGGDSPAKATRTTQTGTHVRTDTHAPARNTHALSLEALPSLAL